MKDAAAISAHHRVRVVQEAEKAIQVQDAGLDGLDVTSRDWRRKED